MSRPPPALPTSAQLLPAAAPNHSCQDAAHACLLICFRGGDETEASGCGRGWVMNGSCGCGLRVTWTLGAIPLRGGWRVLLACDRQDSARGPYCWRRCPRRRIQPF